MRQVFQTRHLCKFFTLVPTARAQFSTSTLGAEEVQVPPSSGRSESQVPGPLLGETGWVCRGGQSRSSHSSLWWHTHNVLFYSIMGNADHPPVPVSFFPASWYPLLRGRKVFSNEIPSPILTFKVKSPFPQAQILVSGFVDRHWIAYS